MSPVLVIAAWIAAANGIAFVAFGIDKQLARNGAWRISEQTLLLVALVGGTLGAIAAQHWFHHKTRKEPFRSILYAIAALQIIGVTVWLVKPDLFSSAAS